MKQTMTLFGLLGLALAVPGCEHQYPYTTQRINAPPAGYCTYPNAISDPLMMQVDNGVMADMTLADIHFIPGRPEINALGEYRLKSMITTLKNFGGTVFIYTETRSRDLETKRLAAVEDYLGRNGLKDTPVTSGFGYARGISGLEGIAILQTMRARTVSQNSGSLSGVSAAGGTAGGGSGQQSGGMPGGGGSSGGGAGSSY